MPRKDHPNKPKHQTSLSDKLKRLVWGWCDSCKEYKKPCGNPEICQDYLEYKNDLLL